MSYDHDLNKQPEILALGQRSGRTELLSRVDLEKIGTLELAASVEQSQSWRNFEMIYLFFRSQGVLYNRTAGVGDGVLVRHSILHC